MNSIANNTSALCINDFMPFVMQGDLTSLISLKESGHLSRVGGGHIACALRLAVEMGFVGVTEFLLCNGGTFDDIMICGGITLWGAARNGHINIIEFLLERGLTAEGISASNAITAALKNGHVGVVRLLLKHCPDAKEPIADAWREHLEWALYCGHDGVARFVIALAPEARKYLTDERTQFYKIAAREGYDGILCLLMGIGFTADEMRENQPWSF